MDEDKGMFWSCHNADQRCPIAHGLRRTFASEISNMAKAEGTSLSAVAHDLIKEALELREDRALADIADERARTIPGGKPP